MIHQNQEHLRIPYCVIPSEDLQVLHVSDSLWFAFCINYAKSSSGIQTGNECASQCWKSSKSGLSNPSLLFVASSSDTCWFFFFFFVCHPLGMVYFFLFNHKHNWHPCVKIDSDRDYTFWSSWLSSLPSSLPRCSVILLGVREEESHRSQSNRNSFWRKEEKKQRVQTIYFILVVFFVIHSHTTHSKVFCFSVIFFIPVVVK